MTNQMMSNNTNGYLLKPFKIFHFGGSALGLTVRFEHNSDGINGILINYHLMSGMLVLVASINFLFDAKDTNRSCMLVALLLVFITIFTAAQVNLIDN